MTGRDSVEETNSGLKKHGDMKEVAEFSEEVENALQDAGVEEDSIEGFSEWRPRKEDQEEDIVEKTVEEASMSEKSIEKQSKGVKGDLSEAKEATKKAGNKVRNGDNPEEEIRETSKSVLRPLLSESVKFARGFEKKVYSKLMVKFNPYFFDSKDFSADLKSRKNSKKGEYTMEVNVPDESYRNRLKSMFEQD